MKKIIITIIMIVSTTCAFSQNYFSSISITDEFGKCKTININGRINISDSTVVIKTPNGIYEKLNIVEPYNDGTKEKPVEHDGNFMYDEGYLCFRGNNIKGNNYTVFVKRTIISQYTYNYIDSRWIIWYLDNNGEIFKTLAFYH